MFKKAMNAPLISMLIILLLAGIAQADKLELIDQNTQESGNITYDQEKFKLENGEEISRDDVKSIYFQHQEESESATESAAIQSSQVEEYLRIAQEMEAQYPEASGLILYDEGNYILTNDGRIVFRYHFVGKVLSTDALNWGEISLYYDEGESESYALFARSISPAGDVSEFDKANVTISEPSRDMAFFGKGKIYSFTIPDVEIGSIVEYAFEQNQYAPDDPNLFAPRFFFQSEEPMYYSSIEVELPKDRELNYITYLMPEGTEEPVISTTNASRIYRWEVRDTPPLIEEPYMPSFYNIAPLLMGSLYDNMDYFYDKFSKFHEKRIEVTPEIEAKTLEVVEGAETVEEKVAKLYHYIQEDIRYISVKGSLGSGIAGHPASYTLNNKYGDCIDKAILFSSMLKVIGVESYPIIVQTNDGGYLDRRSFPLWGGNHAINEVHLNGKKIILDATNNFFRFPYYSMGDCDLEYVNYIKREINYIPPIPPQDNARRKEATLKLHPDGQVEMDQTISFTGNWEVAYRAFFAYTPEARHEEVFSNWLNSESPGAVIQNLKLENPVDFSLPFYIHTSYTIDQYPIFAGDLMIFDVPGSQLDFPEIALRTRKYGLKMDMTEMVSNHITIEIPEGYKVEFLPQPIELENAHISYKASYNEKDNKILFTNEFQRKTLRIPVADYQLYKTDVERIMAYQDEQIFLVKIE
ncbi:DUF3857 and transglutaminase domain-containing protein [bacterium]|nr:DUF3857 and transglutaminase domain-containing protein [bacterium]